MKILRFFKQKGLGVLFLLLTLTVILRIPSLFEPYWHRDEGITLTVGQAISRGEILYKDVADNKTPLLYFTASIFNTMVLFKFWLFFWVILMTLVFYYLARTWLKGWILILSSLIFIILTSTPLMEGNIVNGEIAFLLPNLIGIVLFIKNTKSNNPGKNIIIGSFFALGFLFKQVAIFDFLAVLTYIILFLSEGIKEKFFKISQLVLGFLIPNLMIVFYFLINKALGDYLEYGFRWNLVYSSWNNNFIIPHGLTIIKALSLILIIIIIFIKQKKLDKITVFLFIWFIFSLYASLVSSRHYLHYFLQIVPSSSLLMGKLLINNKKILLGPLFILVLINGFFSSTWEKKFKINYYQNFIDYVTGRKNIEAYRNYFDWYTNRTYRVADFLNSGKRGKIFIWGDEPLIYALSNRSMVGRFPTAYNIYWEKKRMEETEKKLQEDPPRYILIMDSIKTPFEKLDKTVKQKYTLVKIIKDTKIYERKI